MTLCVAWRFQDSISIASDSRISGYSGDYADIGVKILVCPVKVITAIANDTGHFDVLHESTVGIGLAGSLITAYLVKERMVDVLENLQYVGDRDQLTFAKIAEAAFKIYRHGTEELTKKFNFGFDADMFLVGRCPKSGLVSAAKFFTDPTDGSLKNEPILQDPQYFAYESIGSGEDRMNERVKARLDAGKCKVNYMVLEELRAMIIAKEVPSVGGAIQYGRLEAKGFEIYGVVDYRWNGLRAEPLPSVRGVDAKEILNPEGADDLYLREQLITPFQGQLEREMKEKFSS